MLKPSLSEMQGCSLVSLNGSAAVVAKQLESAPPTASGGVLNPKNENTNENTKTENTRGILKGEWGRFSTSSKIHVKTHGFCQKPPFSHSPTSGGKSRQQPSRRPSRHVKTHGFHKKPSFSHSPTSFKANQANNCRVDPPGM